MERIFRNVNNRKREKEKRKKKKKKPIINFYMQSLARFQKINPQLIATRVSNCLQSLDAELIKMGIIIR